MFLDKLRELKNIEDIINCIKAEYQRLSTADRIPLCVDEGNFAKPPYEDFYMKLVLVDRDYEVKDTWICSNYSQTMCEYTSGENECNFHNILVYYNYKHNKLNAINPVLLSTDYLVHEEQDNNKIACQLYDEANSIVKPRIIIEDPNNNNLMLYFPAIADLISSDNSENGFKLYADLEYRVKNSDYNGKEGKFALGEDWIDVGINSLDGDKMLWVRASILINPITSKVEKYDPRIKVFKFDSGKMCDLNTFNLNDDLDAGLVVFDKRALEVLKKYYYFYDLSIKPKENNYQGALIDILDDIVVFWEGEFNRLPEEVLVELIPYNKTDRTNDLISPAMYAWQLEGNMDYVEKMLPHDKLAYCIVNKHANLAMEAGLNFLVPVTVDEFIENVNRILVFCNINVSNLNISRENEKKLQGILNSEVKDLTENDLFNWYEGFCDAVQKGYFDEVK